PPPRRPGSLRRARDATLCPSAPASRARPPAAASAGRRPPGSAGVRSVTPRVDALDRLGRMPFRRLLTSVVACVFPEGVVLTPIRLGSRPSGRNPSQATEATEATVAGIERTASPSSAQQLQDAGKAVVRAAGAGAAGRGRAEGDLAGGAGGHEPQRAPERRRAPHGRAATDEPVKTAKQSSGEGVPFPRREPALVVA